MSREQVSVQVCDDVFDQSSVQRKSSEYFGRLIDYYDFPLFTQIVQARSLMNNQVRNPL